VRGEREGGRKEGRKRRREGGREGGISIDTSVLIALTTAVILGLLNTEIYPVFPQP
jgi:hypothetical protein